MNEYQIAAGELLPKLQARHFESYFCKTAADAVSLTVSLIGKDDVVAWGGSRTLEESGILDRVRQTFSVIDRDDASTPEERVELMRRALLCDTFLMSANAITKDGVLLNIDGNGNRVAALCFGPKQVIVVVGMNKLCDTIEEAEDRAHNVAAVKNAARFGLTKTGCAHGACCDCLSEECMCTHIVKTRQSKGDRIKVVLVGEPLGF